MSTTATAPTAVVKPKSVKQVLVTKKGQALLALLGDPELAAKVYRHEVQGITDPSLVPAPEPTKAERKAAKKAKKAAKAAQVAEVVAPAPEPEVVRPPTVEDLVNELLAKRGFTWARGRVYVTGDVIEAQVRVMRTGSPEVVASSGNGRTVAVAIFKTETGDVAVQNLIRSEV